MVHPAVFYTLAGFMVVGALGVVAARVPVYAVLGLVLTLFAMSALFVCLGAFFLAAVQVLVYAGAVMVLFLFVVMLLDLAPETLLRARSRTLTAAGILLGLLFLWQAARVTIAFTLPPARAVSEVSGTTAAVGRELFTTYALPFELASVLLLVGIIGAIVLAKKKL